MAKSHSTASSTSTQSTSAAGAPAEAEKSKYETMIIGVSKDKKPIREKLDALATKLGCKPSALIWLGIDRILANPPASAPAGAAHATGSACGFWAAPIRDTKGRATGSTVIEVASRGDATGQTFFRYTAGDEKARTRALNQAKRGAQYILDLVGVKGEPTVTELPAAKK